MSASTQDPGGGSNSTPSQPVIQSIQPQSTPMGSKYDDIAKDPYLDAVNREDAYSSIFKSACRLGPFPPSNLSAGNIDISSYLLSIGAPIARHTPDNILSAPSDQQLSLFELLIHFGWTVNTPGFYGAVLLPRVVDNLPLLHWFLIHGADPNLGEQRDCRDRTGRSDTDSCAALERAAGLGNIAAVRLLLDAGAVIQHGIPLHFAAAACPPGVNPLYGRVTPSKEFDRSRIPVMALLVERGADVNQEHKARYMTTRYAIVDAVMAEAVGRVRWLLDHGADAELEGAYGGAKTCAQRGSEEMKCVIDETVNARI